VLLLLPLPEKLLMCATLWTINNTQLIIEQKQLLTN
jgi:hypothetical protein